MPEPTLSLFDRIEHRLLRHRSRLHIDRPVVIGGTGGSGTRVVAQLCEALGWSTGTFLNATHDAIPFIGFYDRWNARWWTDGPDAMSAEDLRAMRRDFRRCVARHRLSIPDRERRWGTDRWGWKNPRSLYLLSFVHAYYPELRYVQVVRDGRDMAFSTNPWPLRKDGPIVLTSDEQRLPETHRAILIWNRGNLAAAAYGARRMGPRHLVLGFEDLCRRPRPTIARLATFLGGEPPRSDDLDELADLVDPPDSLGRWRAAEPGLQTELTTLARDGLTRFGYLSENDDET